MRIFRFSLVIVITLLDLLSLQLYAAPASLPVHETFSLTMPSTNYWTTLSPTNGRIQIVLDDQKPGQTNLVLQAKDVSPTTITNYFVANVFTCDQTTYLLNFEIMLARKQKSDVKFYLYERSKLTGNYVGIYTSTVTATVGTNYLSGGSITQKLLSGKSYLLGVGWTNANTCFYEYGAHPVSVDFGYTTTGYVYAAGTPPTVITNPPAGTRSAFMQRLTVSQEGVLRMDSSVSLLEATNSLTLAANLAGYGYVNLSFRHRESGDESNTTDGVFLSTNGLSWQRIVSIDVADTNWHSVSTNLVLAANAAGMTLSTQTLIRFQQRDNYPWPSDGRDFDDIDLYTLPDLDYDHLECTSNMPLHLKGTNVAHVLPLSSDIIWLGSSNNLSQTTFNYYYVDGTNNYLTQTNTWTCNLSALTVSTSTVARDFTIPAGAKLSNRYAIIRAAINPNHAITEVTEANNTNLILIAVNHYSGRLLFNGIETLVTITQSTERTMFSSTNHLISGYGTLQGYPFSFTNLPAFKNLSTLDYSIDPSVTNEVVVPIIAPVSYLGINYSFTNGVMLCTSGAYANVKVRMPAGLGYTTTRNGHMLNPYIVFRGARLYQTLVPYTQTITDSAYFCEESKPVYIEISSVTWQPSATNFTFVPVDIEYVRQNECARLHAANPKARKLSNEGYYQFVDGVPSNMVVYYSAANQARMNVGFDFTGGTNTAHFPYGVTNQWNAGGMTIYLDTIVPTQSVLSAVADFRIPYSQNCPEELCGYSSSTAYLYVKPDSQNLRFTSEGGLQSSADLNGDPLTWGAIDAGIFAYETDPIYRGSYYMPGHFMRGADRIFTSDTDREPSGFALSGVLTNTLTTYERHGTTNEQTGAADYAGVNVRLDFDGELNAQSILGKTADVTYPLSKRSKYYVRHSGISGIHEVMDKAFPSDELTIYGYPFSFSNYGLSFLSSKNHESRTEGSTYLPFPSDITLEFEELKVTCLGDLDTATVAEESSELHLSYWNANIQPYALQFQPADACDCSDSARYLLLGIRTYCANIDPQLYGLVGFESNGNFITPAFGHQDTGSRLSVPSSFELDGPQGETYSFYPVSEAYFNNYVKETNDANFGFLNIAGELNVPFFDNLMVHLHTSASTNSTDAPIYLMGGWPTDGWTNSAGESFFSPGTFDENNNGYPSDHLTLAGYRSGADGYRVRAIRNSWLNVVDFNYPLTFDTSTRSFASYEPKKNEEFLVVAVEHQVDYLSAENAEISFGVQYDGLPQINLASMAFEAVDDVTGASSEIFSGALASLWEPILDGLGDLDNILSTVPQDIMDDVLDELIDPVVDALYVQLTNSYRLDPANYYSNNIDAYIGGISAPSSMNVKARLGLMVSGGVDVNLDLSQKIGECLDKAETLLNAFNTDVSIDGVEVAGLLATDGDGDYAMLSLLAGNLIGALANEYIDIFGSELTPTLNNLLHDVDTSLQTIRDTLDEIRPVITNLQYRVDADAGLDFFTELNATLDTSIINTLSTNAAREVKAFFSELPSMNASFDEYSEEEIKQMIKQHIKDQFYGSQIPTQITQILRSRLYDLDSSIRRAADSVFGQVNTAIRNLLSDYLAQLDESINEMLGDVSDTMGAGKINGYAHITGDSLTELRLDGSFQWKVPDDLEFSGYLILRQVSSTESAGCGGGTNPANEVILGTEGIGISWISEIKADIETRFSFKTDPFMPAGLAGSFEMVEGTIGFESFVLSEFYAGVGFGLYENYISAAARAEFSSFQVAGGAFFGRTCTLTPISDWDDEVGDVLGEPPFTGIYVYGEGWMPIVDYGCVFNISAGVGAGLFMFVEGPTIGGKIMLGAEGEALCVVGVDGVVKMAGSKSGDDLIMSGSGKISGRAGSCPFCVKFSKTVKFTYKNGEWDADY